MKKGNIFIKKKASKEAIENFVKNRSERLPEGYVDFICENHWVDGDLPVSPFYFRLWSVDEVLQTNLDYQVNEYLPDYFAIGDQGGGEMLVISLIDFKIYEIPFVPMNAEDSILCFESFKEFKDNMGFVA